MKFEKVDILYELTDNKNFEMILNEFKSYSMLEYDINLVKRAIKYIGNIGFKFEKSMNLCVDCISQILNYNQDFTIDQSVIVMRDLLRKYHGKEKPLELLIKINEDLIDKIRLPESKAAILYILGEYCSHIEKSTELIECFYNDFSDESEQVKLQILNACIKNFLTKPDDKKAEDLVTAVLQKGAEETVNADVRDRSYFYWRLLENDPDIAKEMILAEKPSFNHIEETPIDQELCDDILENITNVSCIYHKKYSDMILKEDLLYEKEEEDKDEEDDEEKEQHEKEKEITETKEEEHDTNNDNEMNKESSKKTKKKKKKKNKIIKDKVDKTQIDLLGLGDVFSMTNTSDNKNESIGTNINSTTNNNNILDIF